MSYDIVVRSDWHIFIGNMLCKISWHDVDTYGLYALKTRSKDMEQDVPQIM